MEVDAIALTDFAHGNIEARAGFPVRHRDGSRISEALARDLERAQLVRVRSVPPQGVQQGKASGDGQGQPSSASQAAPASPMTTSNTLKRGGSKTPKRDA